jgi:hypothetical protein
MVPRAGDGGAGGFLSKRTKGSPLKPDTQFLAVDNRIYFLEPGTAVYGRLMDPILEDKVPMTIERFQLPEGARATAIASGPRGGDGKAGAGLLYVTDASQDRIYRTNTEDMKSQPIQLVAGTRPGAMAEGPMGTLVLFRRNISRERYGTEPSGIVYLRLLAKGGTVCGLTWESKGGKGSWAVRRDLPSKAALSVMDGEPTVTYQPNLECGSPQAAQPAGAEKDPETKGFEPRI